MLDPCTFVIFGSTGNLSKRKLLPALYHLEAANRLPDEMKIIGFGRRDWGDEQWRDFVKEVLTPQVRDGFNEEIFSRLVHRLHFFQGNLDDKDSFKALSDKIENSEEFPKNVIFYMSIRPAEYTQVIKNLANANLLIEEHGWRRIVVEKPFGYDRESAQMLQQNMMKHLREEQVFRIDHYLGKGTVQNVLVFRFANVMMEPLWNRNYIDHIQITHSETVGIEGRADYFDSAGALRDMIQSHLLQLLTLVAMEPPASMDAESLRDEKVKVLKSIRPIPQNAVHAHAFRAQYASGIIHGEKVPGYLDADGVDEDSVTETYAAIKLYIDNWRWRGVPIYLRTGKRMAESRSAISIRFKHPPQLLFRNTQVERLKPDWLLLGIQPNECVRIEMQVKESGLEMRTRTSSLDASFNKEGDTLYDAYEGLLLDVVENDHSLFLRYDEVEWAWRVVDPVLRMWATERDFIHTYPAGTWGPKETQRLFDHADQFWRHSIEPED
ncbi:MAG: glucose-6-phosphate dehydrogenase [Gammaproteobacteria bacterium]|nr:glucose-6-phosphate dehydrogenase [Gammaproteobacteria bacterium]